MGQKTYESFVTINQARELRQFKDFNVPCKRWCFFDVNPNNVKYFDNTDAVNFNEINDVMSIPTQSVVLAWLRDWHKIHIQTEPYWSEDGMQWLAKIFKIEDGYTTLLKTVMVNDTYGDAVSKAIDYVTTNLI